MTTGVFGLIDECIFSDVQTCGGESASIAVGVGVVQGVFCLIGICFSV